MAELVVNLPTAEGQVTTNTELAGFKEHLSYLKRSYINDIVKALGSFPSDYVPSNTYYSGQQAYLTNESIGALLALLNEKTDTWLILNSLFGTNFGSSVGTLNQALISNPSLIYNLVNVTPDYDVPGYNGYMKNNNYIFNPYSSSFRSVPNSTFKLGTLFLNKNMYTLIPEVLPEFIKLMFTSSLYGTYSDYNGSSIDFENRSNMWKHPLNMMWLYKSLEIAYNNNLISSCNFSHGGYIDGVDVKSPTIPYGFERRYIKGTGVGSIIGLSNIVPNTLDVTQDSTNVIYNYELEFNKPVYFIGNLPPFDVTCRYNLTYEDNTTGNIDINVTNCYVAGGRYAYSTKWLGASKKVKKIKAQSGQTQGAINSCYTNMLISADAGTTVRRATS